VLAQDPAAGSEVVLGSSIAITVAIEPSEVEVPEVIGSTINEAIDALTGEGFAVRQSDTPVETTDEDGIVLDQNPAPGTVVEPGSRIEVTVGQFTPPDNLDPEATDPGTTEGGTDGTGVAPTTPDAGLP
jgi:serine/threonine-protein kinase